MHGAHDVSGICLDRILVRVAHQRLRRHVDDDFGLVLGKDGLQLGQIADVADDTGHALGHFRHLEQAGVGGGRQGVTRDLRTHGLQPQAEPAAFETGVPGQQDALAVPKGGVHGQTFQGALPDCHSSSR